MTCELKKYPQNKRGEPFSSRSAVIGNILFLSAMDCTGSKSGTDLPANFEIQTIHTLDNIKSALEETGSSLDNLAKYTIFLKNVADYPLLWKTMFAYFQKYAPGLIAEPPAATVVEVNALAKPEYMLEIDAIAAVDKDMPGWEMKKHPLHVGGVKQAYPDISPGQAFLSESVSIGNLLFLSAMNGANPQSGIIETNVFEEQWHLALYRVKKAMENAGSSLSNIIKTLHFQTGLEAPLASSQDNAHSYSPASDRLWKTELEYYANHAPLLLEEFPASTFLKVSSLSNPKSLGQTDVIGTISRYLPGWEVKNYPLFLSQRGFPRHVGEVQKYYSNSVKAGKLVFISGQTATDSNSGRIETTVFEKQMLVALHNLKASVEQTGSSLENIAKTYLLIPDPGNLIPARRIETEFYGEFAPGLLKEPPASTVIHPLSLASPKLLIEIEAIVYSP